MKSFVVPIYKCTESELYSVCRSGWTSYQLHLATFTSRKPYYTLAYGEAALAEIDAAAAMPNQGARKDVPGSLLKALKRSGEHALYIWLIFKSYMTRAYDKETIDLKLEAAGENFYQSAYKKDWEDLDSLMLSGFNFMVANEAKLSEGNNMPPTFTADFIDAKNDFSVLYESFKQASSQTSTLTDAKRTANNSAFLKHGEMLKDGQLYFKDEPAIKQLFIFNNLLEQVSSPGSAGLKGTVLNGTTNGPLSGANLSLYDGINILVDAHYAALSDEHGEYDFGRIAGGNYTLKIERDGFVIRLEEVEIHTGVTSSKDYTLAAN